jgi:shikimate kinase
LSAAEGTLAEHVALIGLPGAGKSVVAALVAKALGMEAVDLDRAVERESGRSVAEIFGAEGESRFRDLESRALADAVAAAEPRVLACGGGVLERPENRALLKARARVVWLEVEPEEAMARLGPSGSALRPLLAEPGALRALLQRRAGAYAEASDLRVATGGLGPEEVAARVVARLWG